MVASRTSARFSAWRWWVAVPCLSIPPMLLAGACWWLTPALGPGEAGRPGLAGPLPDRSPAAERGPAPSDPPPSSAAIEWPEGRLDGREAKLFLLGFMERAVDRLDRVPGYTAELRRQERINGELGPEQALRIKVQHDPFAVYLRFEAPRAGKEALYHEGRFDNHLLAHNGDWTRRFLPRLKVDPLGPIALADNRHPITEAGLAHLSRKLLHFRRLDLDDPDAETILDRTVDEAGKLWYSSTHSHRTYTDARPFAYVEIRYCPDLLLPLHIESYDWPEPGCEGEEFSLAERYHYENVDLDARFTAIDFDPTNPEYGFRRY